MCWNPGTPIQLPEVLIGYQVADDSQCVGQGVINQGSVIKEKEVLSYH